LSARLLPQTAWRPGEAPVRGSLLQSAPQYIAVDVHAEPGAGLPLEMTGGTGRHAGQAPDAQITGKVGADIGQHPAEVAALASGGGDGWQSTS